MNNNMICENCQKQFHCEHNYQISQEVFINHCINCGACETCSGKCSECFEEDEMAVALGISRFVDLSEDVY